MGFSNKLITARPRQTPAKKRQNKKRQTFGTGFFSDKSKKAIIRSTHGSGSPTKPFATACRFVFWKPFLISNRWLICLGAWLCCVSASVLAAPPDYITSAERILFLGDSITFAGHYITELEIQFRLRHEGQAPELINLGLPSETCSGLSEPDHPFPRPNVHERLERALRLIKPDVVVACYGMNDGIYYPFDKKRFAAYQNGVRHLINKVQESQARLIMLTPIPFDPTPLRGTDGLRPLGAASYAWFSIYEHYDLVLENYASWLITQADQVDMVIDLHTPLKEYASQKKAESPDFTLAPDGVHLNVAGHRELAYTVLMAWGMGRPETVPPRLAELVAKRQKLLHLAWLSHVGHLRPDVPAGQPLDEALRQADQLLQQILAP